MKKRPFVVPIRVLVSFVWLTSIAPAFAQESTLKVRVTPKEAYLFLDERAELEGSRTLQLGPGEHKIGLYIHGYHPETHSVTVKSGWTAPLEVSLKSASGDVSGPGYRIPEEAGRASGCGRGASSPCLSSFVPDVVLGGLSFGGRGDEFNNTIVLKQELLVPRATHQFPLRDGNKEVWPGPVTLATSRRAIRSVDQVSGKGRWIGRAMKSFIRALGSTPPGPTPERTQANWHR